MPTLPRSAPNLQRKIQQLRLATDVEHELTPQALLASYLNVADFNHGAYGIQVASEVYFSKNASAADAAGGGAARRHGPVADLLRPDRSFRRTRSRAAPRS